MATDVEMLLRLLKSISDDSKRLLKMDLYMAGEQPLKYMAPALEAELGADVSQVVINWPRMVVEAYENRQDVTGFRFTSSDGVKLVQRDGELWDMFLANDGPYRSQQLNTEILVMGRSYVIVGAGESKDDAPVFTEESPLQMAAEHDPKTRQVTRALKHWEGEDKVKRAALYLPNSTVQFVQGTGGWKEDSRNDHGLGRPPVVEFLNRGRMLRQLGVSAFHDVIPIADAANKMATDMMISGDFHAMPRRWALGFGEDEFVDDAGKKISAWSVIKGRIWSSNKKPGEAQLGQFPEADLANFRETIKLLAQITVQLVFLPDEYMAFTSVNPPSADSQRAGESRFVKRVERQNMATGTGLSSVMQLMWRIRTGKWDANARAIQTLWRDPATPTIAQVADAVVKKVQAGIIPVEFAREELGYTLADRDRMRDMDRDAVALDPLAALADQFRREAPEPVAPLAPVPANAAA